MPDAPKQSRDHVPGPIPWERFVSLARKVTRTPKAEVEKRETAWRKQRRDAKLPEVTSLRRSRDGDHVQYAIDEHPLRVGSPARPKGAIGAKILVYESDLDTSRVEVCENLAPGAGGQAGPRRTGMGFGDEGLGKVAALSASPKAAIVEQPADLDCLRDANGGRRHGDLSRTQHS
jgi:hypothetical protein